MLIRLSPNPFISISLSLLLSLSYLSFFLFLFFLFIPFLFLPLSLFFSCALVLSCVHARNWCSAPPLYFPFLRSLSFFRLLFLVLSLPLPFARALSVKARNRWRSVKHCNRSLSINRTSTYCLSGTMQRSNRLPGSARRCALHQDSSFSRSRTYTS